MNTKKLFVTLMLAVMLLSTLSVFTADAAVAGTLALVDPLDGDNSLLIDTGSPLPAGFPNFQVDVMITNVTNVIGTTWSINYNSSLFAIGASNVTAPPPADHYLYPTGGGGVTGVLYDHATPGSLGEFVQLQLAPTSPKTYTDPSWGEVMNIQVLYIGPTPSVGEVVTSLITIVNNPGSFESTQWTADGITWDTFATTIDFNFTYTSTPGTPYPPTASFTISPPAPRYPGDLLTFDASSSTNGFDGDSSTPITAYVWDFGDGSNITVGVDSVTHTYNASGIYDVCLIVVAPGVPTYIDPGYVNTSTIQCESLLITVQALTGIDVFTEDYRWPCYTTEFTGEGANQSADAFLPQEKVTVCAYVFYNGDPVQNKPVSFVIEGPKNPFNNITIYRTAFTSGEWDNFTYADGYVCISFRVPWPCNNSDAIIFGNWTVTASVVLPLPNCQEELCHTDVLTFKVGWVVQVLSVDTYKVTTRFGDGPNWDNAKKCGVIGVRMTVHNNYMEPRMALLTVTMYDDVGTPIGTLTSWEEIAPGDHQITLGEIHIPKWAYSGPNAIIYGNAFYTCCDESGALAPWGPEVTSVTITLANIVWTDCATAWMQYDGDNTAVDSMWECIVVETQNGTGRGTAVWAGRYYASYVLYAEQMAIYTDHVVDLQDVRDAWIVEVIDEQNQDDPCACWDYAAALAHVLAAEATCGFVC